MPYQSFEQFEKPAQKRRIFWFIGLGLFLLLLLASLLLTASVFQKADQLMTREPAPFNYIASHLMPPFDELSFQSLDQAARLHAWYFKATAPFRGNVLLVHHNGRDRLQFGLESGELYRFLMAQGFHVMAVDLRHSGRSDGERSTYGFSESYDVLAALSHLQRLSGKKHFVLYGIGSGSTASLLAYHLLPEVDPGIERRKGRFQSLAFGQVDIKAMIFDTPAASAYDYIQADLNPKGWMNQALYYDAIPGALRLAVGGGSPSGLASLASQVPAPMLMLRNVPNPYIAQESIETFIAERLRLHPKTSHVYDCLIAGHLNAFLLDREAYLQALEDFLDRWFDPVS